MAEELSFDEGWWKTRILFASNENVGNEMLGHASEEKTDKLPLDPNMCNENQKKQLEVELTAGADNNQIVSSHDDGDGVQKRNNNGKGINDPAIRSKRVSEEKKRRDIEAKLYRELLALLPHLTIKDDKAKIVQEAENSIKSMEETLRGLEKQKKERLRSASQNLEHTREASIDLDIIPDQSSINFKGYASSNVTLNVCGADAVINICSQRIPDLFTTICYIFKKHDMEVVYAEISSDHARTIYLIHVRANVPPQLAKGFPYEQMYYKAVAQIEQLVTFQN